jgi:hypothetical protein
MKRELSLFDGRIEAQSNMPQKLTNEIITAAIFGFEQQKIHIDTKISELRSMLNGGSAEAAGAVATPEPALRKRKKVSAAARRKMALAQKARWAKIRGEAGPTAPAVTPTAAKAKRRISKEGMARIIAATKKRWAKARAEMAAKAKLTVVKKTASKKAAVKRVAA